MSYYQATYSLHQVPAKADELIRDIRKQFVCIDMFYSCWLIKSDESAKQVYLKLESIIKRHIKHYHLIVIEVNPSNNYNNLNQITTKWIKRMTEEDGGLFNIQLK